MVKGGTFRELIDFIFTIWGMGYDVVICISGDEQSGKSTLAIKIVSAVQEGKIDLEANIGYTTAECVEEIPQLPDRGSYILDEAIRAVYKRDFQLSTHKELNRIFAQVGMKKALFIFNIPNFLDLDKFYRKHRVRIWIRVLGNDWDYEKNKPKKFYAATFLKDTADNNPDPWFLATTWAEDRKEIQKKNIKPMLFTDDIRRKKRRLTRNPCLKWFFTYPPMPDPLWKRYKAMSKVRKMSAEAVDNTDRWKERAKERMKQRHEEGATIAEIAKEEHCSVGTAFNFINDK